MWRLLIYETEAKKLGLVKWGRCYLSSRAICLMCTWASVVISPAISYYWDIQGRVVFNWYFWYRIKPTPLTTPLSTQMISLLFLISVSENYQIQWGILIVCCQQNVIQVVPRKKRKEYSHHGKIPSSNFRFSILSQYVFLHLQIIWIVYLVVVKGADNSIISKTVFWYQDS